MMNLLCIRGFGDSRLPNIVKIFGYMNKTSILSMFLSAIKKQFDLRLFYYALLLFEIAIIKRVLSHN